VPYCTPKEVRYGKIDLLSCPGAIDRNPEPGATTVVGTYKIISQDVEVRWHCNPASGQGSPWYLVLTPSRFVAFYTGDNRKFGTSVADKAALLDTLVGWSGTYRVEGGKIVFAVDASWTEVWTGKDQVRNWSYRAIGSHSRPVRCPFQRSIENSYRSTGVGEG